MRPSIPLHRRQLTLLRNYSKRIRRKFGEKLGQLHFQKFDLFSLRFAKPSIFWKPTQAHISQFAFYDFLVCRNKILMEMINFLMAGSINCRVKVKKAILKITRPPSWIFFLHFSLRMTASEALKHKWVKKKPQYYPTKSKAPEFKFKPVALETVSYDLKA